MRMCFPPFIRSPWLAVNLRLLFRRFVCAPPVRIAFTYLISAFRHLRAAVAEQDPVFVLQVSGASLAVGRSDHPVKSFGLISFLAVAAEPPGVSRLIVGLM